MKIQNKIKIYTLNKQEICEYLKYPDKLENFDLTQGTKQIKNDILLKKIDILERKNKTRWLTYNTYIGSTQSLIFNPKFQIKTHFLKNQLKNQVFTGTFFKHLDNYNPYFFMSPDIYLKKRLQILKLFGILHKHLKKYINSKFFRKFTGKKKMVLLYLKKIELKKIIIAKIKKLYLPYFLHEENLKYKNFGFDQLKTNIKTQFDINKKNIYPVFVSQNLTKLNLNNKTLNSFLIYNKNFNFFDLINNLYKEKNFPLTYTSELPFNENLKDLEFLRKNFFKKVKRNKKIKWTKEFKKSIKNRAILAYFNKKKVIRKKKHIKLLNFKVILNSQIEILKEQLKKSSKLIDSLFSGKSYNNYIIENLDFKLEALKENNKHLKQKLFVYDKLLNVVNKRIKLSQLHLNNDFSTLILKFKKLKQNFLQLQNNKISYKPYDFGSNLHEKSQFSKFSQENKLFKNLNNVFLILKLIKELKKKKHKLVSLRIKRYNSNILPNLNLKKIKIRLKNKIFIPKTIVSDLEILRNILKSNLLYRSITFTVSELTEIKKYLTNRKGRRILDGIIRNPFNPLGLKLLILLTSEKTKKVNVHKTVQKFIHKKGFTSSENSKLNINKVINYFKFLDLFKKYKLLGILRKSLKLKSNKKRKIKHFAYLKDKKYNLSKLNKTNLRKKLVAKDIYHFFFHGLKFDRWDFDRWIPIPLV